LGGFAPDALIADGRLHRFATSRRKGDEAGWYKVFDDGFPLVVFGDWRSGLKGSTRVGNGREISLAQREQFERVKRERETRQREAEAEAAQRARQRWDRAKPAYPRHKYLTVKGIAAHGLRQDADKLLIPLYDGETLISLQQIGGDGDKRFTLDSRTQGGSYALGEVTTTIWIGEGYATCATIFELTGLHTIVAFNSKNLVHVARKVHAAHPKANIVILADDDYETSLKPGPCFGINPGIRDARAAAEAVGARVAVPSFNRESGDHGSDWNDFRRNVGNDETRRLLKAAETGVDVAAAPIVVKANGHDRASAGMNGSASLYHVADPMPPARREPKPLPSGLLPVPQFDLAYLPDAIAPWVADIADRMQCPLEYVAVPAIVALGAALGRKVAIRPQRRTDWLETPNLWGCVVGRPGAMKSPAATEALKPLVRLETNARAEYEASLKAFAKEDALAKIRKDEAGKAARAAIKSGGDALAAFDIEEPEEPKAKRFLVNDTSYEALGEILADNPNGVLAFRDELVSLLKTLDREEYAATRGFFLTAWNGTSGYTFDRIVRGRKHIEAACLSLLGGTQPGRIAEYMRRAVSGGAGDDGLIQRFGLLVWPDQSPEWKEVDRFPDSDARHAAWKAFEAFEGSSPESFCATRDEYDALPYLRFDDAAQDVFAEWRADLEHRLRSGDLSPALESHLSKYRKLVPGLALINHLADGGVGSVCEAATLRALALTEYLETHARRAYAAGSEAEAATAKAILARVRKGELADGFTLRDVHQKGWANLTDRDQVKAGLDLLVDLDWLAAKIEQTGGRPRTVYMINPGALA
jgi:putative DNA primase/helicase